MLNFKSSARQALHQNDIWFLECRISLDTRTETKKMQNSQQWHKWQRDHTQELERGNQLILCSEFLSDHEKRCLRYEFNGSFVSYVFSLLKIWNSSDRRPVKMRHQQPLGTHVITTPLLPHLRPFWLMVRNRHTLGFVGKPLFVRIRSMGAARHHFERLFNLLHF